MDSIQYIEYLIDTAKSCGEHHTIPVQPSELMALKAIILQERAGEVVRQHLETIKKAGIICTP